MTTACRIAVALVRSAEDLARARRELGDLFSWRQQDAVKSPNTLLGVWLDEDMVTTPPHELTVHNTSGANRTFYILETTGVSDIWTLCWLDTSERDRHNDLSRLDLIAALIHSTAPNGREDLPFARFIPVISSDATPSEVRTELGKLLEHYPHHLMPAWFQDSVTGRWVSAEYITARSGQWTNAS